jgi:hypothetical protein
MVDELYCNRMLPSVLGPANAVFEEKELDSTLSSFPEGPDGGLVDFRKEKAQLIARGLSCFTLKQNDSHKNLVSTFEKSVLQSPSKDGQQGTAAKGAEEVDTRPLFKSASAGIKSAVYQASKVICSRESFHIEIPLPSPNVSDSQERSASSMKSKCVDVCRNTQYSLRIPVKGHLSPLTLKFDYRNQISGKSLSRKEMVRLKGHFDLYYSRKNPDPRANPPDNPFAKKCDGFVARETPPSTLQVHARDFLEGTVPFTNQFVYVTIDCGEESLLDDVRLDIRASTQAPAAVKRKKKDSDDENGDEGFANPVKQGLQAFIARTNDHIEDLIADQSLWQQFQATHLANTAGHSRG